MGAIDIGSAATDRDSSHITDYTIVSFDNPANDTGTIDTIEVWADTSLTSFQVATFIDEGSNVLSTRDSETIGNVTSGSMQTISGLDMDVVAGDYIGFYASAGQVERSNSVGVGYWYLSGDSIPAASVAFSWLGLTRNSSIYGTGKHQKKKANQPIWEPK